MNNVLFDYRQTPFDGLPEEPSNGDTHTLKWTTYTYDASIKSWISSDADSLFDRSNPDGFWPLKDAENSDASLYVVKFELTDDPGGVKAYATNKELILDIQKNELEHRIYVQKTIALQHGTEEEFAEYFSQLDAMLDAEDVFNVTFPPAPFQE